MAKLTGKSPYTECLEILTNRYETTKSKELLSCIQEIEKLISTKSKTKFRILRSKDKQYYGILVARNGKVMDTTETMKKKQSVLHNFHSKQTGYAVATIEEDCA